MKNPSTAVFLAAMALFALATGSVSGAEAAAPVSGTTNASATPANGGASQVRDIDNEYFRVTKNGYSGPKAEEGIGSRVIVALNDVVIPSSRGELKLKRGETAVFRSGETFQAPSGQYFEVAFKKNHPPLKSPDQWVEPVKNTVVYEDDEFRIFEERLEPGDTRDLHSHAQRVVIRLNEVQLIDPRLHEDARPGKGVQVPDTAKYADPIVHAVKNMSKIPLFNVVIEFKLPN